MRELHLFIDINSNNAIKNKNIFYYKMLLKRCFNIKPVQKVHPLNIKPIDTSDKGLRYNNPPTYERDIKKHFNLVSIKSKNGLPNSYKKVIPKVIKVRKQNPYSGSRLGMSVD